MAKAFFDSNVIIYTLVDDTRSSAAESVLIGGGDISVQVLNEVAAVARRKLRFDWNEIELALAAIRRLVRAVHAVDLDAHLSALSLAQLYGMSIYDALITASALAARCDILYSEDMQDQLLVEGRLRIVNPFKGATA